MTVGRLRIRVRVTGSGPPLLLVMGIGGQIEMWRPLEQALKRRQTIAFDAPGTGESSLPGHLLRMKGLARVTERLIDQLGYERVDVLGVSFGGALAQQLALQAPERVRRLILAATSCGLGGVPSRPLAMLILATPHRYYSRRYLRLVSPYLYGGAARRRELLEEQVQARLDRPPSLVGYLLQLAAITGWSSLPFLHRLGQPTLVMAGDDDPIIPLANGRILARRIRNAHLHVVEGGGHLFLLDRAAESAEVIEDFLSDKWRSHGSRGLL
ncbi:MAG TPA: alpha/beta hydrolase [Methylomirabilota bacterium]|nr:alpha/beta hydrolase [Methylomirabilota bacterium]